MEGKEAGDIKDAKKRVKEIEAQFKATKYQVEELTSAHTELKETHAQLEDENSRIKAEMKQLKRTNKDLKASVGASDDERPAKNSRKDNEEPVTTVKSKKRVREDSNEGVDNVPAEVKRPAKKASV